MNRHKPHHFMTIIFLLFGGFWVVIRADISRVRAAAFAVTTTADSGPGSLRQAITDANASPGLDTITFAIGATGSQQTIQPATALPSITSPVVLDGWSQGGAGYSGPPLIELNGALAGSYGLRITSGGSTVRGLAINGFTSGVILLTAGGNWIYGNYIGTNMAGETAVANTTGIAINADSSTNIIGTNGDGVGDNAEGNLISGNGDWGILFAQMGTAGNVVAGNKIGTNAAGTTAVPNGSNSSSRAGIYLGGTGNRIGANSDGIADDLERNLISGNNGGGIAVNSQANPAAAANVIAGNYIGTDNTGLAALPNSGSGISSFSGPNYNVVIRGNVIAGNGGGGIAVSGLNQSEITGSFIGVGADGSTPLGNGSPASSGSVYGIYISGSDNQIGGSAPGEGNIIAHQTAGGAFRADGIAIGSAGVRNRLRGNAIYANKDLGIDLNDDNTVNPNDDGDGDSGANNLQNYPVLAFAQSYVNGETVITGTMNSQSNTTYDLDFYTSAAADDTGYGEGEDYLGADQVTTDASGMVTFTITLPGVTMPAGQFVTATTTDPDGSTSEFSLAFGPVSGVQDVPISGLTARVTPPIFVDIPTAFVASVSAGSNVAYGWAFGDGNLGSGAVVQHTFAAAGTYTATVTASNGSGSVITETAVTVLEPANINGVVWYDKDEDGFLGLGESAYLYPGGAVVTATLQNPLTTLTDVRDNWGNYQILTPQSGLYVVEAGRPFWHTTSPSPVPAAMSSDGGVTINFGMNLNPTAGTGRINGRSWADNNANGYPDPGEPALPNLTITLRNSSGILNSGDTDATGWINLPSLAPGTYWVDIAAPPGYYPALQTRQVTVVAGQVVNAHALFLAGGTISGQVSGQNGVGIGGVTLTLLPDNVQTMTTATGSYSFNGLSAGNRTLQIAPPANYVTPDNVNQRLVPVALNSGAVENWALANLGQVVVQAKQISSGQALPLNNMFFELWHNGSVMQFAATDVTGQAVFTGLAAGTYVVKPLPAAVLPGSLVMPAERTAVVTLNSASTLSFNFNLARSLSLHCRLPGTPPGGFACHYEIRNSGGSLIDSGFLPAANPSTTVWNLNPATLEVRLIPDTAVAGQESWPNHSQIVVLDDSIHAAVYYPFNPTNPQTISGYAFWDHCVPVGSRTNSGACNETGVSSSNGLTVNLFNEAGTVISSTVTANGSGLSTGAFSFANLPVGVYRAAIELPAGHTPTTAVQFWRSLDGFASPEPFDFGYQLAANRALGGRVFTDNNSNGIYDAAWDDPLPDAALGLTTPAGQPVTNVATASDGSFTITPITSGEYRLALSHEGEIITRVVSVPVSGSIPLVNFPLPPAGSQPRILLFIDSNQDGEVGATEQRLSGVSVSLLDSPCTQVGSVLETVQTLSDGMAIFAAPLTGQLAAAAPPVNGGSLCAVVAAGLPNNLLPVSAIGVNVPRTSGAVALLAVQPTSVLSVDFFWDADGDAVLDGGETAVGGGTITVNGSSRAIPANGPFATTFLLLPGSYPVMATPPYGYQPGITLPITAVLNPNAPQTIHIPLRAAGGISGRITGAQATLVGGLPVELENVSSGQVWQTIASTLGRNNPLAGRFAFTNLPGGTYRLRLPTLPPGYAAASDPLITLPANAAHTENLALAPVGHISGEVYIDINGDGLRQSDESGTNAFVVQLVGMAGQVLQSATPAPDGSFILSGLNAATPYALQLVFPNGSWFTTAAPGVFTLGAQTVDVTLGVGYAFPSGLAQSGITGQVIYRQDGVTIPVANARVVLESSSGAPLGEQRTGADGNFLFTTSLTSGRARIVNVPGFNDSNWYGWVKGDRLCGQCVLINGAFVVNVGELELTLAPVTRQEVANTANNQSTISWSVFRDDNGSGWRDSGEPGLPGATLGAAGSSQSNGSGLGTLTLADGLHTLTITPPDGFVVNGPAVRQAALAGVDMTLPAIPLRPAGLTLVTAFLDTNGNGRYDEGEAGLGGAGVILTGPAAANGTTAPDGRIQFDGLPDGAYTLSVAPPVGFAAATPINANLADGGMVHVPVQPVGVVTAVLYEDWDGDGGQGPDEPGFRWPFTLTLQSGALNRQTVTAAGIGEFWGVAAGDYALAAVDTAVTGTSVSLPANGGAGAGLPVVPAGVARGAAWLDTNGDGLRQPDETQLAGVPVTLNGQTVITDKNGRFAFTHIAPGNYDVTAVLPDGLTAAMGEVVVLEGRGTAVGIAARTGFVVYLPVAIRG